MEFKIEADGLELFEYIKAINSRLWVYQETDH